MKPDIKWINFRKAKNIMSTKTHKEFLVYEAHTVEDDNLIPYIEYKAYMKLLSSIKAIVVSKEEQDMTTVKEFLKNVLNQVGQD